MNRILILFSLALISTLTQSTIVADTNSTVLEVRGDVEGPLQLSLTDLLAMPRTTVKAREKNGDEATFEGVALSEVIQRSRPRLTEKCCGNVANTCVIVRATDNYRVLFSLAEIEPDFTDRKIILVDRRDGKPLPESQGPLRLVVPGEKVHARWVRQVKSLEIVHVGTDAKP